MAPDKKQRLIALAISVAIHLLIFSIGVPDKKISLTQDFQSTEIVIKLDQPKKKQRRSPSPSKKPAKKKRAPIVKKVKPKQNINTKPAPKVEPTPQQTAPPSPKTEAAEPIAEVAPKPQPGDRDKPVISQSSSPIYPKIALNNDWVGKIVLELELDENGVVTDHNIKSSTGHDVLDDSFLQTVLTKYEFLPKREFGKNVKSTLILSYEFE